MSKIPAGTPVFEPARYPHADHDPVNHPRHYTSHPSGIEVIEITRHMNFNVGNVIKYLLRAGLKDPLKNIEDHEKAAFYLNDEIKRLKNIQIQNSPKVSLDHVGQEIVTIANSQGFTPGFNLSDLDVGQQSPQPPNGRGLIK